VDTGGGIFGVFRGFGWGWRGGKIVSWQRGKGREEVCFGNLKRERGKGKTTLFGARGAGIGVGTKVGKGTVLSVRGPLRVGAAATRGWGEATRRAVKTLVKFGVTRVSEGTDKTLNRAR